MLYYNILCCIICNYCINSLYDYTIKDTPENVLFGIPEPCCTPLPLTPNCQTAFSKLTLSVGPFNTSQE